MKFDASDFVIVGVNENRELLAVVDGDNSGYLNLGVTPEDWGYDNMAPKEVELVKASLVRLEELKGKQSAKPTKG